MDLKERVRTNLGLRVKKQTGPPSSPTHGRSQALPEANHTTFDLDAFFLRARCSERLELKWRLRARREVFRKMLEDRAKKGLSWDETWLSS
ncbi:hypothetical protein E5288_WYG009292 [Bos mutus]|uniref:Uncharacterized protein n=1 Tax=Bos mutus TaxID=72004 RepID=A0A6B0RWH0_9CETA|nr:hypothetical protein [Bos mutus]